MPKISPPNCFLRRNILSAEILAVIFRPSTHASEPGSLQTFEVNNMLFAIYSLNNYDQDASITFYLNLNSGCNVYSVKTCKNSENMSSNILVLPLLLEVHPSLASSMQKMLHFASRIIL